MFQRNSATLLFWILELRHLSNGNPDGSTAPKKLATRATNDGQCCWQLLTTLTTCSRYPKTIKNIWFEQCLHDLRSKKNGISKDEPKVWWNKNQNESNCGNLLWFNWCPSLPTGARTNSPDPHATQALGRWSHPVATGHAAVPRSRALRAVPWWAPQSKAKLSEAKVKKSQPKQPKSW